MSEDDSGGDEAEVDPGDLPDEGGVQIERDTGEDTSEEQ